MNRRLRVAVVSALLAGLAAVIWFYFAPIGLGGGTGYVITHGVSMEPLFHTGDLAIVRAASTYKIGEIVAYHSSLLHEVVLHRIVAIHDGRYTFKGDNNDFFDPVHPTRSQLIGRLWIHLPHVGLILEKLRTPVGAAALAVAIGLLLLGFEKQPAKGMRV
ncbi:MAG TPA: signal peptidase I, partial [Solirubrobacteraceae bacterium]|nr:signal peptidase I [Solirubrobacteraceae bacterium]